MTFSVVLSQSQILVFFFVQFAGASFIVTQDDLDLDMSRVIASLEDNADDVTIIPVDVLLEVVFLRIQKENPQCGGFAKSRSANATLTFGRD